MSEYAIRPGKKRTNGFHWWFLFHVPRERAISKHRFQRTAQKALERAQNAEARGRRIKEVVRQGEWSW